MIGTPNEDVIMAENEQEEQKSGLGHVAQGHPPEDHEKPTTIIDTGDKTQS